MNQTGLSGTPRRVEAKRAKIERIGDITNSQVVYGDNNVVIWGDGNTVIQKVTPNQLPNVARLPGPTLVGRPAHAIRLLDRTAEKKLAKGSLASGAPVEFYGPAGLGKSTLLRYLAAELAMQDGMVFLELRTSKKLEDLLQELFEAFYQSDQNYAPNEVQLRRFFENIQALILLDDSSLSREEQQSLRYMLPRCVLVTTSAEQRLWGEGSAIGLRGLPMKQALALLQQYVGRRLSAAELPAAERICAALEGSPLQIIQATATVRNQKKSLEDLARQFETPAPEQSLQGLSISSLPDAQKNLLAVLAVLGTAPLPAEHIAEILQARDLAPVVKDLLERGLIKAHSPRYSLTGSLDAYLNRTWDLSAWKETVLRHFTGWSARPLSREQVTDASEAIFKVLENAATANRWQEVLQIGQAVEPIFILGRRWGAWARVLPYLLRAGQMLGERAIEAWALHEAGTRLLCTGQFQQARDLLSRALEMRKAIGDKSGIAATEHNLAQLPGGTPPHNPPRTRGGSVHFNGWIIGLVIGIGILGYSLFRVPFLPAPPPTPAPTSQLISTGRIAATTSSADTPTPVPTVTGTVPPTDRATATPTPTITPTGAPAFEVAQDANCRSGPGTRYPVVTSVVQGVGLEVIGQNSDVALWWLVVDAASGTKCWVSDSVGTTNAAAEQAPYVAAPPIPTATPSSTPLPFSTPTFTPTPTWTPTPTVMLPPPVPSGFTVTAGGNQFGCWVTLTWNDVPNETYYAIMRSDVGWIVSTAPDVTSYTDSPQNSGIYYYSLIAANDAGESQTAWQSVNYCPGPVVK